MLERCLTASMPTSYPKLSSAISLWNLIMIIFSVQSYKVISFTKPLLSLYIVSLILPSILFCITTPTYVSMKWGWENPQWKSLTKITLRTEYFIRKYAWNWIFYYKICILNYFYLIVSYVCIKVQWCLYQLSLRLK